MYNTKRCDNMIRLWANTRKIESTIFVGFQMEIWLLDKFLNNFKTHFVS